MIGSSRGLNLHREPPLEPPRLTVPSQALHGVTTERTFNNCIMDLREVVVLDGIDILPDKSGFCIRSDDRYGHFPEIRLRDSDDRFHYTHNWN
jgi:hypothetical protein